MLSKGKIALIYFSRSADLEANQKNWLGFKSKSQRFNISKFLHLRSLKTIRKTNLDVLHFDETLQHGQSFGENLGNAFEYAFGKGYEYAISIGNDCLELHHSTIEKVANKLLSGQNVLGPTFRNGAYLIALNKESFIREKFIKLSWQTDFLETDLLDYFNGISREIFILKRLIDTNHLGDVKLLLKKVIANSFLLKSLKNILASLHLINFHDVQHILLSNSHYTVGLRAPPYRF